jgi:hypothetical protein
MDVRDRLQAHLADEASRAPHPDLMAVMDRGETMKTRRRVVAVALPAALVALVALGVAALGDRMAAPREADLVAADAGVLQVSSEPLEWETTPASLGWGLDSVVDDDLMYVLSTAPGTRWEDFPDGNVPRAVYTSGDGAGWESHDLAGRSVVDLAIHDGVLYTIGTAPGAREGSVALEIGVSTDGATSFETTTVPTEGAGWSGARMAVTDAGIVALASAQQATPESRLPASPEGMVALWSADGTSFEQIPVPFDAVDNVFSVDGGILVTVPGGSGLDLYHSADGRRWRPATGDLRMSWAVDAGRVGDRYVVVGTNTDGTTVSVSTAADPAGPWEPLPLDDLVPRPDPASESFVWVADAVVDDHGVAISLGAETAEGTNPLVGMIRRVFPGLAEGDDAGPATVVNAVLVSPDLRSWKISDGDGSAGSIMDGLLFTPAGGLIGHSTSVEDGVPIRHQLSAIP